MPALEAERALAPEGLDVAIANSYPRSATCWLFELGQVSCTLQAAVSISVKWSKLRPPFQIK